MRPLNLSIESLCSLVDANPADATSWLALADAWQSQGCFEWYAEIRSGVKMGVHPFTRQPIDYRCLPICPPAWTPTAIGNGNPERTQVIVRQ